ncbi:zinc finger protein ZAT5-like isoform X2 [Cucurbita maxima]|uniref:Zinc finger protein ZAT5-like isoform X2 n=1 Tax=Cucurbita maxima TaxID=3661 RepID=A0A6J1HYN5_CUCMA|nr:zinc finger protein ZAT5-like isoform X2 [Cucurbita maxima]
MEVDHEDGVMGSKEQALIAKENNDFVAENKDYVAVPVHNVSFSPSSSSAELQPYIATDEEEDMANCLILLAQGRPQTPKHVDNNRSTAGAEKGVGIGCYGYECKTCYRTFPSFQALGGHRASHKKSKAIEAEKKVLLCSDDEEIQFKNNMTHSISLQLNQKGSLCSNGKGKVHECAICGAEFTSGQALGGHMRRHRAMPVAMNTALSLTPMAMEGEDQRQPKRQRNMVSLDLDLNLPAPQEHDHHRESKFMIKSNQYQQQQTQHQTQQQTQHQTQQQQQYKQQQQQQQQQQPLVFPARTLVDCHY